MRKKSKEAVTEKYWKEAKQYVREVSGEWFAFEWSDDARWQWEQYFAWRLGLMPAGLTYLKQGKINEFLVPCENPRDFDGTYIQKINRGDP